MSREHLIAVEPDGLITIAGGKLTTYRRMGAELIDKVVEVCKRNGHDLPDMRQAETDLNPLPGAMGWPESEDCDAVASLIEAAAPGLIDAKCARMLSKTYGMRGLDIAAMAVADESLATPLVEGRTEIEAQVIWAATEELAATVSDVMIRRTQLFFRDKDQGLTAVDRVAELLSSQLNWSTEDTVRYAEEYRQEVQRSRDWRTV